ncbi:MAG: hypothetical protein ACKOGA_09155 [Planctomycetaceae bacterium]
MELRSGGYRGVALEPLPAVAEPLPTPLNLNSAVTLASSRRDAGWLGIPLAP